MTTNESQTPDGDDPLTLTTLGAVHVPVPHAAPPTLFVVVDTEEEFDWDAPPSRDQTSVRAMRHVDRLQTLLSRFGVRPTYVVDYPVATQRDGYGPLLDIHRSGAADIGAHLHPWVTPPLTEELSPRHTFGYRLGKLEAEKIRILRDAIAQRFDLAPAVFKAGRYGFGETTARTLEDLGFDIDVSINPRFNFVGEGGPDFSRFDTRPFFFGRTRRLLEIPCTTDYIGVVGSHGRGLYEFANRSDVRELRLVGVLARLGILNRVLLSPEGYTIGELKAVTRAVLARGVRTLSLTLHSPSLMPGCTPYVRTTHQLERFLDCIREYCDFFFGEIGGIASTPTDFFKQLPRTQPLTGATLR